jgi:hypothetical protein
VAIPSRVLGAGVDSLKTVSICGDGVNTLVAAGTSAGDATTVTYVYTNVSTVTAGAGIKLPPAEMGETITIANTGANVLTVYPSSTANTINGAASSELLPGGSCIYSATSNTTWVTLQGYQQLPKKRYGALIQVSTLALTSANVASAVTFTTIDPAYGVSIGSPASRVVVADTGVYDIQFSAQVDNTSGGDQQVWIWPRVNGVNVPNSASTLRIKGNDAETVASWNFLLSLTAGQYVELMWTADSTNVVLLAASATSVYPAIPAVILTVNEVSL